MVRIERSGQDKTDQISDWEIRHSKTFFDLVVRSPSGERFRWPLADCRIEPTEVFENCLLSRDSGRSYQEVKKVVVFGEKQALVRYPNSEKDYLFKRENVVIERTANFKQSAVFQYFLDVAEARAKTGAPGNDDEEFSPDSFLRSQLDKLLPNPDSVLNAYLSGKSESREAPAQLIFPFGLNESQLLATRRAFQSQVSVIQGPPGTGKTQTILNIIANIVLKGGTVAVLSNANSAVENIYEKLKTYDLDYLSAQLGNRDNRSRFFEDPPSIPDSVPAAEVAPTLWNISRQVGAVEDVLHAQTSAALLKAEIRELLAERRHLTRWIEEDSESARDCFDERLSARYQFPSGQLIELIAFLNLLEDKPVSLRDRLTLFFRYRIVRTKYFRTAKQRNGLVQMLQRQYYDKALRQKELELASFQKTLEDNDLEALILAIANSSLAHMRSELGRRKWPETDFKGASNRKLPCDFFQRFPIVGSSTHSVLASIGAGTVIDYAIIDEASQQDILPGILAMGCARNLIIVGDTKQLRPVLKAVEPPPPDKKYDCSTQSLLDSCLKVFGETVPVTLLKEHYRCDPMIIQFCNQQFYENQLIPMTEGTHPDPMRLIVTAKGNHARGFKNLREIDSILHILERSEKRLSEDSDGRGFIAPYNAQVDLAEGALPVDFASKTAHKFQGRECDEIVFSTVLDKKSADDHQQISFVDDPQLVNVAVSRAKKQFTLVIGEEVFDKARGHIAALVRYIEYYGSGEPNQIIRSPVVSAFDLLYQEYDKSLNRLKNLLRSSDSDFKSEQIVAQILRESLIRDSNRDLKVFPQIPLNQIVSARSLSLTKDETAFLHSRSSCDFVIYYKVGKKPLAVIEVDGGSHESDVQRRRDALKDSILQKAGVEILRLKTVQSRIEERIVEFLHRIQGSSLH
ncbi:MAG: AAA domain-containing protein [Marinobacter sp.]|uniref:AAA domain-containing protein n=1 Tax=Marinobacter sp. TaxID=50741 RepID=UPI0034A07D70